MTHRHARKLGAAIALWLLVLVIAGLAFAYWHGYRDSRCNAHDPVVICLPGQAA